MASVLRTGLRRCIRRASSSFLWRTSGAQWRAIRPLSLRTGDCSGEVFARRGQVIWPEHLCQNSTRSFASSQDGKAEITVPFMGESVRDGTIAAFSKKPGDYVKHDDLLMQIETDKVTIDVRSTAAGRLEKILVSEGDNVSVGTVVAIVAEGEEGAAVQEATPSPSPREESPPAAPPTRDAKAEEASKHPDSAAPLSRAATSAPETRPAAPLNKVQATEPQLPPKERERRVPMTRLRKRVATRLKDSQNTFALLTTFNEIDMTNLMELKSQYSEKFLEKHGVKFGFMSCFVKATVSALQQQPVVNAVIDGDDIIYRDYIDISIAVGTQKGLVVPVIRGAEKMNFAEIEKTINELAKKANDGSISIDEMAGGTFTISNGGVYGSLLSTPIINPPQSAILGMHTIQKRPMVVQNSIIARPMMYIALTYDHRLIDGREAVYFLRRIKDVVEDPRRLLLDV